MPRSVCHDKGNDEGNNTFCNFKINLVDFWVGQEFIAILI